MSKLPPHPMQPLVMDGRIVRFRSNKIVQYLIEFARERGCSQETLASMPFDVEDRAQLAQLSGYSVTGYGELDYVPEESVRAADGAAYWLGRARKKSR